MNLKEFIDETLSEILAGIRSAQSKEGGKAIGAEMRVNVNHNNLVDAGTSGVFTIVDFDVSVVAETETKGKAGIKVFSIGSVEGGGGHAHQEASRIKFAVQLKIPDDEPAKRPKGFGFPQS